MAKDEINAARRGYHQSNGSRRGAGSHTRRGGVALEMGIGLQVLELGQKETDSLVHWAMHEVVEDKVHAQMSLSTKMQVQRQ